MKTYDPKSKCPKCGTGAPEPGGKTCRHVEIGKKEIPIYELQCDEEPKTGEMPILPVHPGLMNPDA